MGGADLGGQADVGAGDVVDVALDVFKNAKFVESSKNVKAARRPGSTKARLQSSLSGSK